VGNIPCLQSILFFGQQAMVSSLLTPEKFAIGSIFKETLKHHDRRILDSRYALG